MGEGAREEGAWVACAGGRFAGFSSGRSFTQEYIASAFQSDTNEGKRGLMSGLWMVVVPRIRMLSLLLLEANSTVRFWAEMSYFVYLCGPRRYGISVEEGFCFPL